MKVTLAMDKNRDKYKHLSKIKILITTTPTRKAERQARMGIQSKITGEITYSSPYCDESIMLKHKRDWQAQHPDYDFWLEYQDEA